MFCTRLHVLARLSESAMVESCLLCYFANHIISCTDIVRSPVCVCVEGSQRVVRTEESTLLHCVLLSHRGRHDSRPAGSVRLNVTCKSLILSNRILIF